jgi:hypothetical protein
MKNEDRKAAALARAAAAKARIAAAQPSDDDLAKLEREADDAEALAAATEAHGAENIAVVRTPGGAIILRRPGRAEWQRWADEDRITSAKTAAMISRCLVTPAERWDAILDRYPACLTACLTAVSRLAGAAAEGDAGK